MRRKLPLPHPLAGRTVPAPATWEVIGDKPDTGFAENVASNGDLNGDGFDDLVFSAPHDGRGKAFVYFGGTNGLPKSPSQVLEPDQSGSDFGSGIAIVGDLNGDGLDDLLVSCSRPINGGPQLGYDFFPGSRSSLAKQPAAKFSLQAGGFILSSMIIPAGDLNGDGFSDFALWGNESSASNPNSKSFVVLIFHGSADLKSLQPAAVLRPESPKDYFGAKMAPAGDVNGDGFDDLIIGVPNHDGRYPEGGKVYVHYGSRNGLSTKPDWTAEYDLPVHPDFDQPHLQEFGFCVASAGDVNGDGYADIIIGAPFAERRDRDEGLAFIYLGSAQGLAAKPALIY